MEEIKQEQKIHFLNDGSSIEEVPIDSVFTHPRNPRKGNIDLIRESLQVNGFYGVLIVQKTTNFILVGNHRYKALLEEGETKVPVIFIDVDDDQALRILLADNRTSDIATYDNKILSEILENVKQSAIKLRGTGFKTEDLREILQGVKIDQKKNNVRDEENRQDFDPREDMQREWKTQLGQLWQCGDHRLMIGSSTDPQAVSTLFGGEVPLLMVTDPPYGVNYDPGWRNEADTMRGNVRSTGKVANDHIADWRDAYKLFPGDVAYVWHAAIFTDVIMDGLRDCNFIPRTMVVWKKQHFAFSRSHYHQQYEMAWYAVRKGKSANWQGGRKQSNVWEIRNLAAFGGGNDELDEQTGHGTQKPIECMRRPIENHTNPGDSVYDAFLGSGTSLIAAESTGRRGYGIELDPGYGAIILDRMKRVGIEPHLISGELSDITPVDIEFDEQGKILEEESLDSKDSKAESIPIVPVPKTQKN